MKWISGGAKRQCDRAREPPVHDVLDQPAAAVARVVHDRDDLRFGRIVASDAESPHVLVNMVYSGRAVVQRDNAAELYADRRPQQHDDGPPVALRAHRVVEQAERVA